MALVGNVLEFVLTAFLLFLIFRLVMEYVFLLARSFRPSGAFAMLLELTYTVTDPPLKALRRVLPPLRIGQFSLDLGFLLLFIVVNVLINVAEGIG